MNYKKLEALSYVFAVICAVTTYLWVGVGYTAELNPWVATTGILGTAGIAKIISVKGIYAGIRRLEKTDIPHINKATPAWATITVIALGGNAVWDARAVHSAGMPESFLLGEVALYTVAATGLVGVLYKWDTTTTVIKTLVDGAKRAPKPSARSTFIVVLAFSLAFAPIGNYVDTDVHGPVDTAEAAGSYLTEQWSNTEMNYDSDTNRATGDSYYVRYNGGSYQVGSKASDGSLRWENSISVYGESVNAQGDNVFVKAANNDDVYLYDSAGNKQWQKTDADGLTSDTYRTDSAISPNNGHVYHGTIAGTVKARSLTDGTVTFNVSVGGNPHSIDVNRDTGNIYVTTQNGDLYKLDSAGNVLNSTPLNSNGLMMVSVDDDSDTVYTVGAQGTTSSNVVYKVDGSDLTSSSKTFSLSSSNYISGLVYSDDTDRLYIGETGSYEVHAIDGQPSAKNGSTAREQIAQSTYRWTIPEILNGYKWIVTVMGIIPTPQINRSLKPFPAR